MRQHPLAPFDLEPRVDLARIYSDKKRTRTKTFLEQRQQEADKLPQQIKLAPTTCDELHKWLINVETEERNINAQFKRLERDLRDIRPALGYELEDNTQPDVVPMPKK